MNQQKRVISPPALLSKKRAHASVSATCPEQPSQHGSGALRHLLREEPDYGCVDWFMYAEPTPYVGAGIVESYEQQDIR